MLNHIWITEEMKYRCDVCEDMTFMQAKLEGHLGCETHVKGKSLLLPYVVQAE